MEQAGFRPSIMGFGDLVHHLTQVLRVLESTMVRVKRGHRASSMLPLSWVTVDERMGSGD